jgi:hypothetical protein
MKARLYVSQLVYGTKWYWNLESLNGTRVMIEGDNVYSSPRGAERAARRWAKKHNIEIVKEGEA